MSVKIGKPEMVCVGTTMYVSQHNNFQIFKSNTIITSGLTQLVITLWHDTCYRMWYEMSDIVTKQNDGFSIARNTGIGVMCGSFPKTIVIKKGGIVDESNIREEIRGWEFECKDESDHKKWNGRKS